MPAYLCLSLTLYDETFHGRRDGGEPEWPPSPLRLFQALVAAAAAAFRAGWLANDPAPALRWLEEQNAPWIVAPVSQLGCPVRIAVPNNDLDVVARSWARGQVPSKQPSELKTLKTVRPIYLHGGDMVHYVYPLQGPASGHAEMVCALARSITHLGWGIDMATGHGRILGQAEVDHLQRRPGYELWQPCGDADVDTLRVPITGTLEDLERRYRAFHDRLGRDGFNPPPPLTAFVVQGYHRSGARPSCPFAAFEIWKPIRELAELPAGRSMARPFDPVRSAVVVAAMVRAAAARAAKADGWPEGRIRTYIHGHAADGGGPARGPGADRRLAFLPLPSITPLRVESIRRVLVVAPPGDVGEVEWLRETLAGQQLQPENGEGPVATLTPLRGGDANLRYYIQEAQVWSTVTPVVLPGRFTKGVGRTMRLLRAALAQAGWPRELIAGAEFDWREEGYRRGVDLARRYRVPEQLRHLAKQHLRIRWPVPVRGPLALGAGRYRGVGVFAAEV